MKSASFWHACRGPHSFFHWSWPSVCRRLYHSASARVSVGHVQADVDDVSFLVRPSTRARPVATRQSVNQSINRKNMEGKSLTGLKLGSCTTEYHSSFLEVNFTVKFQRENGSGDAEWQQGGKLRNYQQINRRISETVQGYYDGLIGSRMCAFDLAPRSMTLDGPELL